MNDTSRIFEPGAMLAGRYRVDRLLGSGSCGTVYLANDEGAGETAEKVVLKVVSPALFLDEEARDYFVGTLHYIHEHPHPSLVAVRGVSAVGSGQVVVVNEYIAGETLEDRIQKAAPLPPKECLYSLAQLCDGLAHLHLETITHGYLKPGNVLISPDGNLKIADAGFGRLLLMHANFAHQRGFAGDPYYLAPEQISELTTTIRSDVYAVGVILYEMLTGKVPFNGRGIPEVAQRIVRGAPIKQSSEMIAEYAGDVPGYLVRTVMNAMQREPMSRFSTIPDMLSRIEPYMESDRDVRRRVYVELRNAPAPSRKKSAARLRRRERSMLDSLKNPVVMTRLSVGAAVLLMIMLVLYNLGEKNRGALDAYGKKRAEEITSGARQVGELISGGTSAP